MSSKKVQTALSLIEVAETNLRNAKNLLLQLSQESGIRVQTESPKTPTGSYSKEESEALEVVEGYFDGENMMGDNGQVYLVPQNYASKTQLVIGDRMKWILTSSREVFKLINPAPRARVTGTFAIEGEDFVILTDEAPNPVKILKASATYAMKNLGLRVGDEVAVYIPKESTPIWGAFISVVKAEEKRAKPENRVKVSADESELDALHQFSLNDEEGDFF